MSELNQLNLFGGQDEVVEGKKGKQTNSSQKSQKSQTTTKAKPQENIKVQSDWTIYYYGENFRVDEFVDYVPEEGVTLDQVRAEMEKDFAEMAKERTHWEYDKENKRLFPVIKGAAKGCL